jgi:CheY-like chemotaxis protein/REP element-mobilizing transposase RayT
MTIPVLVVDAAEHFGILIRQTLEETDYYQVTLTASGSEAIEIVQSSEIRLAIVDFDLPDIKGPDIIRQLRAVVSDLAVIAIPVSSDPDDPELKELKVDGVLTKPFYLPDLPQIVATALDLPPDAPTTLGPIHTTPSGEPIPSWLEDSDQAGQYLTQLFLDIQALAALLTRGQRLWAYAGDLDQTHAEGIANLIVEHWTRKGARGAVAKFISLPGTDREFMFYTTHVGGDLILSLIFVPDTPFSVVRRQGEQIAKTLSQVNPAEDDPSTAEGAKPGGNPSPGPSYKNSNQLQNQTPVTSLEAPELLPDSQEGATFEKTSEEPISDHASMTDQTSLTDEPPSGRSQDSSHQHTDDDPDAEMISHVWEEDLTTEPHVKQPGFEQSMVLSAVLIPRSPNHQLSESLAERLSSSLVELGHVLNWEFTDIDIQPEYLCFTFKLPSKTPPAGALEQIRQELSSRVLKSFPDLSQDVPERRFWAHNYLLTTGGAPSGARIQIFIQNTRRSQNYTP